MKLQLLRISSVLLLITVATNGWADGISARKSFLRPCAGAFSGTYIGAAVGYGNQRAEITNETAGVSGRAFKDNDGSVTFGGYAGYNWQRCDGSLFGIETDFNYFNTSPTASDVTANETVTLESRMDWFGTLRGRAGYVVHDDLLLYATGGIAYAREDHTVSDTNVGTGGLTLCGLACPPPPPPPPPGFGAFAQSNKDTKVGWTVGGGAEYLHDTHWMLRAEALYIDLGGETHEYVACASCRASLNWDDRFWVARLGLAYKFGEPEAAGLK